MSAIIDIRSHRHRAIRDGIDASPATDELVAELASAVGADRGIARDDRAFDELTRHVPVVGTPDGPRQLITIQPDRHGSGNDLVAETPVDVRRRWIVTAVVSIAMAIVLAVFAGMAGASADGDFEVAGSTTLQSGETLWHLADEITPAGQDVRPNLQAIMDVNDFQTATLPAGTLVLLPAVD